MPRRLSPSRATRLTSASTLLAGFQIAPTQPIGVDDVVIVEGEWGKIEDITLTYVVVCIWDLRRLVVPITHVIEQPFENWTRPSRPVVHCELDGVIESPERTSASDWVARVLCAAGCAFIDPSNDRRAPSHPVKSRVDPIAPATAISEA
jgi:hypothetical protein